MEFRLLGQLEVLRDGRPLAIRGKPRIVLAMLLLNPNRPVPVQSLIDALWQGEPPATSRQTLQYFVHRLRRLLGGPDEQEATDSILVTHAGGYLVRVEPGQLDVERFMRLVERGNAEQAAGDLPAAAATLETALALWRGPALADFAEEPFAQPERVRLEELHLTAVEQRLDILLALGRHTEIVGELEALVRSHPLREQLRRLHILGLYRCGRQAEALAAYRATRRRFVDELGIEPGTELQQLEQDILVHAPALDAPATADELSLADAGPTDTRPAGPHLPEAGLPEVDGAATATVPAPGGDGEGEGDGVAAAALPRRAPARHAPPAHPGRDRVERRVITAMVAGLVETSHRELDPEDHVALRAAMLKRVQEAVRRYGGAIHTVLGGTLLAVFGALRAREDDPERAVRAAMAVAALGDPAGLAVRVGVETGAAIVSPTVGLEQDLPGGTRGALVTGITGSALDTAAYLEVTAAPGAVLVGPAAHRATLRQVDYQGVRAGAWQPLGARSRIGSAVQEFGGQAPPLVERHGELALLRQVITRVRQDLEPQLLTIIGAPGIGKSRIVAEFGELVDQDPELITWRQARSVPYGEGGDGVTLWALAEIVRAQAGILPGDAADAIDVKLHRAVAAVLSDQREVVWVEQRLRPLVQVAAPPAETDQRKHLIDGWSRFIGAIADDRPLVLVVEDLQWADGELLECLHTLLDRVGPVPLLVLCTARPQLLENRPDWGGGKRNAVTVSLTPLSERGSTALLNVLLREMGGASALPEATRTRLLANAGGNPLYLEEYVRMLRDAAPDRAAVERLEPDLPLPETIQQIIAARLDALPPDDLRLLQDMAVLGEVGWREPLVAMTGLSDEEADGVLARLQRNELLRPVRAGTATRSREYVFRHALVRDVAYGQLLRSERADKHARVAEWLASAGAGDRAEQVAHHYQRALTFSRAAGLPVDRLAAPARLAFRDAGDRAAALGALATAARYYDQALELWPRDDHDRPDLLLRLGRARAVATFTGETELVAARDAFEAAGESGRAAEASALLGTIARLRGDAAASKEHNERAASLAGSGIPTRASVTVLSNIAKEDMVADRLADAIRTGRHAVRMAAELGIPDLEVVAAGTVGAARVKAGDIGGLPDLVRTAALLEARHDQTALIFYFARVRALWRYGDLAAAADAVEVMRRAVDTFGAEDDQTWMDVHDALLDHAAGRWDDAVEVLDRWLESWSHLKLFTPWCLTLRGAISLDRGDPDGAARDAEATLDSLPPDPYPEALHPALALHARALLARGERDGARRQLDRLLDDMRVRQAQSLATTDLAAVLVDLDLPADSLPEELLPIRWHEAARAFVARDFDRAARLYALIGAGPDEALARLYEARRLAADGRREDAAAVLAPAVAFWDRVGAVARRRDADAVLGDAATGDAATGDGEP